MNKTFKILEIVWLIFGIYGIAMSVYSLVVNDRNGAVYFIAITIASGIMYAVRKKQRKKAEQHMEDKK